MNITETRENNIVRLHLDGRFDANTCDAAETYIRDRIQEGAHHFVMDLENVPFIASAGLRVILVFAKELRQKYNGDLRIAGLQPNVNKVFEISGLNSVLRIFDTAGAATESFAD